MSKVMSNSRNLSLSALLWSLALHLCLLIIIVGLAAGCDQGSSPGIVKPAIQAAKPWTVRLGSYVIQFPFIPRSSLASSSSDNFRYHRLKTDDHELWIVGAHLVIDGDWYGEIEIGSVIFIGDGRVAINDAAVVRRELPAALSKWIERCRYPVENHNGFFVSVSPDVHVEDVIVDSQEAKYTLKMNGWSVEIMKTGIIADGRYQQLNPGDRIIIEKRGVVVCGINTILVGGVIPLYRKRSRESF